MSKDRYRQDDDPVLAEGVPAQYSQDARIIAAALVVERQLADFGVFLDNASGTRGGAKRIRFGRHDHGPVPPSLAKELSEELLRRLFAADITATRPDGHSSKQRRSPQAH